MDTRHFPGVILVIQLLVFLLVGQVVTAARGQDLQAELTKSYNPTTKYEHPTDSNLQQAVKLFSSLVTSRKYNPADIKAWKSLGFNIRTTSHSTTINSAKKVNLAIISETSKSKGNGFYAINLSWQPDSVAPGLAVALESTDKSTADPVRRLFLSGNYLAAAWTTTDSKSVDYTKERKSYFNAFNTAFAKSVKEPEILNLIPFNKATSKIDADVILSSTKSGTEISRAFSNSVDCLQRNINSKWNFKIQKFPEQTSYFGGSLNLLGQNFYDNLPNPKTNDGVFLQVAVSGEFRKALNSDSNILPFVNECFVNSY